MVGGYIRVSTDEQEKDGYSLADQEARFMEFVREKGLPYKVYKDVQSGSDPGRRDYQKLCKDIRAKKITGVWIVEFSRSGRNLREHLDFQDLLREFRVDLYINGNLSDIRSIEGQLIFELSSTLASHELRLLKDRLVRGRTAKIKKGAKWFGPHLYGYEWVFDSQKGKRVHKQKEEEITVLKQMYRWFLDEKLPYKRIADRLNQRGNRTKLDSIWDSSKVSRTLNKSIYAGFYHHEDERIESKNYPPVISPEQFAKVEELASKISSKYDKDIRYNHHQSSSLLYCWHCKKHMIFHHKKWFTPKSREPRYRDIYKINHAKNCNRNARAQAVKESILDYLFTKHYVDLISDLPSLVHFYKEQRRKNTEQDEEVRQEMEYLSKQKETLRKKKKNLIRVASEIDDLENDSDIAEKITDLNKQISVTEAREEEIKQEQLLSKQELHRVLSTIGLEAVKQYNDGDPYQRRVILSSVIKDAYIKDRLIHIEFVTGKVAETHLDDLPDTVRTSNTDLIKRRESSLLEDCIDAYVDTFVFENPYSDIDDMRIMKEIES